MRVYSKLKQSCSLILILMITSIVPLWIDSLLVSPIDSYGMSAWRSRWTEWQEYRRKHIIKIEDYGIVRIHPLHLHIKFRREPGPHLNHNTYLRNFRKQKPQPKPFANYSCAPWIPKHERRIHFTFQQNWNFGNHWTRFQEGRGHLGGESYWLVGLEYILQHMGFEMVSSLDFTAIQALQAGTSIAHILNEGYRPSKMAVERLKSVAHDKTVGCKTSVLAWWNKPYLTGASFLLGNKIEAAVQANRSYYFDKRRFIYPFKDPQILYSQAPEALSIPFIVHGQILLPTPTETEAPRGRRGFLLSKTCDFLGNGIMDGNKLVLGLLAAGFELHTTCTSLQIQKLSIPDGLSHQMVHHGRMRPAEFSMMLRSMAFVIGFGFPTDSPTPFEGLYNGAAFLNPVFNLTRDGVIWPYKSSYPTADNPERTTQHIPLRSFKPPYVYNYEVFLYNMTRTVQNVLEAAELSVKDRFASFIPEEHRLENVMDAVCHDLIEYNYNNCGKSSQQALHQLGSGTRLYNKFMGTLVRGYYMLGDKLLDQGFFN